MGCVVQAERVTLTEVPLSVSRLISHRSGSRAGMWAARAAPKGRADGGLVASSLKVFPDRLRVHSSEELESTLATVLSF